MRLLLALLAACSANPTTTPSNSDTDEAPSTIDSARTDLPLVDTDLPPADSDSDVPTVETESDPPPIDTDRPWTDPECVTDPAEPVWVANGLVGIWRYALPGDPCMTSGSGVLLDLRYWDHRLEFDGAACVHPGCADRPYQDYGYIQRDDGVILYLDSTCQGDVRDPAFLDDQGEVRFAIPQPVHCP